ncbi:MAG TPA: diguanylate cyclase [Terriglobia bacterium]|nr:diguanylate cyclase [Terriglobia bacterium]
MNPIAEIAKHELPIINVEAQSVQSPGEPLPAPAAARGGDRDENLAALCPPELTSFANRAILLHSITGTIPVVPRVGPMAFTVRNLKIRDQMLLVTLPPLFVLLCAVALFFYAYWSAINTGRAALRSKESVVRGNSFLWHTTEASTAVRGYILTHRKDMLAPYDKAIADGLADLNALSDLDAPDPGQPEEINRIRAEFDQMQKQWALPAIERVRAGVDFDTAATLLEGQERMAAISSDVSKLRREDEGETVNGTMGAEKLIRRMLVVGVSLAVILAGILIFLTGVVTRLIVLPVLQLIRASEQVGRGDYAPVLPPVVDNEFGVLSRSFSHMTTALRREHEEIASLNRFSEAVTQCTSEIEVYDLLLHSLKEQFQPRQVIIFKLNQAENYLEAAATLAPLPQEVGAWPLIEEPHNCKAVRTGRSFVVNDVQLEPLCPSKFLLPSEGSYYCGPLIAGGIIIGSVRMEAARDLWTPDRQRSLESYLSGAASALSNLRLLDRMKEQANIDVLTGLYNRRFLEDYARKLFAIARRRRQPVGLIMLDLDRFKSFNDVYGHEIGDRILRHFAKTVTVSMRETNLASRYGGEEFIVLLPDTNAKSCALVAERIRKAVISMVVPSNSEKPLPQLTVSIGVAVFPEHGQNLEEIIQASDKALYESKHSGRNRVTVASTPEAAAG